MEGTIVTDGNNGRKQAYVKVRRIKPFLFIRHLNGRVIALIIYVDIILIGNETQERFWDKRVGNL